MTALSAPYRLAPLLICLLAASAASPLSAAGGPPAVTPPPAGGEVWITLGADAYRSAAGLFPVGVDGRSLPILGEAAGVVLTRIPETALGAVAERIHADLGHHGGFVVHRTLADAEAELDRLRQPPPIVVETLPFTIDEPYWVGQLADPIDEGNLLATMTSLSTSFLNRYHAHMTGTAAAEWIRNQWAAAAQNRPDVTVTLRPHTGITPQPSVVLTIPGSTLPDEIVILGGHEDSVVSGCSSNPNCVAPGADDNGSGIAVLTEVIRVAMDADFRPQRTVQIMAYAAEEVGLWGSGDIAAAYYASGADVVAVLQQDMTDYHGSAEDVAMISDYTNPELNVFLEDLLETYQPGLLWTTSACGYGCSDHYSWHQRGYPAAFAFESRMADSNPWIHTAGDTVANLGNSAAHAAKFARLAAAFLVEASLDGPVLPFADGFESGDTTAWTSALP
jgi:leucyl aminopeptidase